MASNPVDIIPIHGKGSPPDEAAVYHVMSRTALDGFPVGNVEKDFLLTVIQRFAGR